MADPTTDLADLATKADVAEAIAAIPPAPTPAPPTPPYDDTALRQAIADLAAKVDGLPTGGTPAGPSFDAVHGGDWTRLAAWMNSLGSGDSRPEVTFGATPRTLSAQIPLRSGHRLIGTSGPAREFGTGAVWKVKAGLPSFFGQVANAQSYPASTGVRDFFVQGVEFTGAVPVLPPHDIAKGFDANNAVYYTTFRDCGFVGTPLVCGWGDGLTLTGTTHVNSMTDTFIRYGGANMMLGSVGELSYMDSNKPAWLTGGKPFIETWAKQWSIGTWMISARQTSYGLLVSGGENGRCIGTFFDAPDSNPTQGAAVRVTGGDGLVFDGCSFHNNHGVLLAGGTSDVVIDDTVFNDCPEVLTVQPGFKGVVKLGLNAYAGTTPRIVKVASLSQIVCTDPKVEIQDLTGKTLRAAA